jgi:Zn ribbon nucleic-acid-binding protein
VSLPTRGRLVQDLDLEGPACSSSDQLDSFFRIWVGPKKCRWRCDASERLRPADVLLDRRVHQRLIGLFPPKGKVASVHISSPQLQSVSLRKRRVSCLSLRIPEILPPTIHEPAVGTDVHRFVGRGRSRRIQYHHFLHKTRPP